MALWARNKVFGLSRGYYKRSNNCFTIALRRVFKALQQEYRDRRVRRRNVRKENIMCINAAVRDQDVSYSKFVYGLNRSNMMLDRKILSDLAKNEPYSFKAVLDEVKEQVEIGKINKSKITYQDAIDKKMLNYGVYQPGLVKDIKYKFAGMTDKSKADWYGLNDPNFPDNYLEQQRKFEKNRMPLHEMKKLRFTAWDDIPSEEDDLE